MNNENNRIKIKSNKIRIKIKDIPIYDSKDYVFAHIKQVLATKRQQDKYNKIED
jgi:hypothetical protein